MQARPSAPPLGVVFDASFDERIDQVLALALLFGLEGQRQLRLPAVSTSRHNLHTAIFLDLFARFYGGEQAGDFVVNRNPLPIGMSVAGTRTGEAPAMLAPAVQRKTGEQFVYPRGIDAVNGTADPVALIRNALSAQVDGNAAIVLAGPPVNLLQVYALPDGRDWVARKVRTLTIAAGRFGEGPPDPIVARNAAAFGQLLEEWPSEIVMAGLELDDALPYPGRTIEEGFTWTSDHPVADAYRAFRTMPYDAPSRAIAAAFHAARPDGPGLRLSEPGTIRVLDDGRTVFAPAPDGRHRYLIAAEPDARETLLQTWTEIVRAEPPRRGGGRGARPAAAAPIGAAALTVAAMAVAIGLTVARSVPLDAQADAFDTAVRPVVTRTCAACHNAQVLSGGLDLSAVSTRSAVIERRDVWERVLRRLRAGDMPPAGVPRPEPEALRGMVAYLEERFDRADAATAPDPGRMTVHRLTRVEYANTIEDLLGVRFRADRDFPADDSVDGFDNIADVLTVSPLLMERYLSAAERIAAWALSTEMPRSPLEAGYLARERRIRRLDRSTIEADHRVEFAGEYVVRFGLPGERPKTEAGDAAPVTLGFWMDGELLTTKTVQTKPSGLVYFDPYSEEEIRIELPAGDHTFRAGFMDDPYPATLSDREAYDRRKNKFLDSIVFVGPHAPPVARESRRRILVCAPDQGAACVTRILDTLASRAYRRPATADDVRALQRFVDLAVRDGGSIEEGLQLALQAALVSPHFLFRIERDPDPRDPSLVHEVSPYDLASRLSYFLWSSMPDEELFALAESGRLRDPAVLAGQVDRMLADSRAAAFAGNFAGQWLETRNLDIVAPDPDRFPEWDAALREAMKQETTRFFDYVLREDRPIGELLDADYTFLNERLARHYGIDGVTGPDVRRVALTTDRRGGVLSQAGVLTVSSYPTRTSPVIRGKYVLQNILGIPPAPPPADVASLDETGVGELRSMREQLERHRTNPTCASCHRAMDPLGFGLENYDAIGRWRDLDGKFPVDASGTLPDGQPFETAGEMRARLATQLPQFTRTITEKMLVYALRRGLEPYDRPAVERITRAVAADEYRFRTLVHEIVKSLPFRHRRGDGTAEAP